MNANFGCGERPCKGINIDIKKRKAPNFILASIEHIPLIDKCVNHGFCHHVLEHVDNLARAMNELKRVCHEIEIRVPFMLYGLGCEEHKRIFNLEWFKTSFPENLKELKLNWTLKYTDFQYLEIVALLKYE